MEVGHRGHRVLHWVEGPRGGVAVGWEVRRGTRAEVAGVSLSRACLGTKTAGKHVCAWSF